MATKDQLAKRAFQAFFVVTALNLLAEVISSPMLIYLSKPLLMVTLGLAFFWSVSAQTRFTRLILLGLFFSWGGDVLLMLVNLRGEGYFVLGLASFLMAHVCYITAFWGQVESGKGWLKKHPWLLAPFLIYLAGLTFWWWNDLGALRIPVSLYSAVIITMGLSALNLKGSIRERALILLVSGAMLFILSDSMIAINKFKHPFPAAHLWIMITYLAAQYGIAGAGIAINQEKEAA